jgi:rhodanese-related sulfurtransferase
MDELFLGKGFDNAGIRNLTPRETLDICRKGAILIDVREEYMNRFKMIDVPEVIYCPFSILEETYQNLPKDKPMIFADAAGLHSKKAVQFLIDKGFGDQIANMAGGLVEWERDGLPLIIDKSEQLSGSCMCQLRPRNKKTD